MFSQRSNSCAAAPRVSHICRARTTALDKFGTHLSADCDVQRVSSALHLESHPSEVRGTTRKYRLPSERSRAFHNCNYDLTKLQRPLRALFGPRPRGSSALNRYMLSASDNRLNDCDFALFRRRHLGGRNLRAQRCRWHISNEPICSFSKFRSHERAAAVLIHVYERRLSTAEEVRPSD